MHFDRYNYVAEILVGIQFGDGVINLITNTS